MVDSKPDFQSGYLIFSEMTGVVPHDGIFDQLVARAVHSDISNAHLVIWHTYPAHSQ